MVALLRNKLRSVLTVLGITIGIEKFGGNAAVGSVEDVHNITSWVKRVCMRSAA